MCAREEMDRILQQKQIVAVFLATFTCFEFTIAHGKMVRVWQRSSVPKSMHILSILEPSGVPFDSVQKVKCREL